MGADYSTYFSIPYRSTFINIKPLREFSDFTKVPDASKIPHFKQDFIDDLQLVFDMLVDFKELICQAIDSTKSNINIFNFSVIDAFVIKNNPKTSLNNAAFDTMALYKELISIDTFGDDKHSAKAFVPLNPSVSLEN